MIGSSVESVKIKRLVGVMAAVFDWFLFWVFGFYKTGDCYGYNKVYLLFVERPFSFVLFGFFFFCRLEMFSLVSRHIEGIFGLCYRTVISISPCVTKHVFL